MLHNAPPEWVVVKATGKLAIVVRRVERGLEVSYPHTGQTAKFANDKVQNFDPKDYPVQVDHRERKKMRAAGIVPKDEVEKVCNQCLTLKPATAFPINQTRADGSKIRRPTCEDCREGVDGVRKYDYRADGVLVEKPPMGAYWQCSICEKAGIVGVTVKLVLDHDHLTGHAREYICDSCNTGLGRFRNGHDYLGNALTYLERWTT